MSKKVLRLALTGLTFLILEGCAGLKPMSQEEQYNITKTIEDMRDSSYSLKNWLQDYNKSREF